jgi:hypothetical protein
MSKLRAVQAKTVEPSKPKILIYGKSGVGKTWGALDFPAAYYIDTEGGASHEHYTDKLKASGGVYFGVDQGSMSFDEILNEVKALATEKHNFKTLIIDSISKIFLVELAKEADRLGDKDQYGASKKKPVGYMRQLVSWIARLDMNVILIAHEKSEWGMNAKGERVEVGTTFDCWDKLEYELDLALNINKAGANRIARIRKSRLLQFQEATTFPWSYDEFAKRYGKDVIERDGKQVILATDAQLEELNGLVNTIKLPEGQAEAWLKKANVESFAEMDSDKLDGLIKHIRATYLKTTTTAKEG